jgi:two-component system response regulator
MMIAKLSNDRLVVPCLSTKAERKTHKKSVRKCRRSSTVEFVVYARAGSAISSAVRKLAHLLPIADHRIVIAILAKECDIMDSSTGLKSTNMTATSKPKRIEVLLVENNNSDADLAVRALAKTSPDIHVQVVSDGADALDFLFNTGEFAQRHPAQIPDLILLNLKVPVINGLEVIRILKAYARTRMIPVVVLTKSGDEANIREAYSLGANSCIHKSTSEEHFMKAIEHVGYYWLMLNHSDVPFMHIPSVAAQNIPAYSGV